jgi:hypothetical protein
MYSYLTLFNMAVYWRCPQRLVQKIIKRSCSALATAAVAPGRTLYEHGAVRLPPRDELRERTGGMRNPGMGSVDLVLDGQFHETGAPSIAKDPDHVRRAKLWSTKESKFGVVSLIVTTLDGLVCMVCPQAESGEQSAVKEWGLKEVLAAAGFGLLSDANFTFNYVNEDPSTYIIFAFTVGPTTLKNLREILNHPDATAEQKAFAHQCLRSTKLASQMRIVVENRIRVHRRWAILSHKFRQYLNDGKYSLKLADVVLGLAYVSNVLVLATPLRAPGWVPAGPSAAALAEGVEYGYPGEPASAKVLANYVKKEYVSLRFPGKSSSSVVAARTKLAKKVRKSDVKIARKSSKSEKLVINWTKYAERGDFLWPVEFVRRENSGRRATGSASGGDRVSGSFDELDRAERKRKRRSGP